MQARGALAMGAEIAAAACDDYALDQGLAPEALFAFALIDAMFELELAALPIGIHVVRD